MCICWWMNCVNIRMHGAMKNIAIFVQLELQWRLLPSGMRRIVISKKSSVFRINFYLRFQDRYPGWEKQYVPTNGDAYLHKSNASCHMRQWMHREKIQRYLCSLFYRALSCRSKESVLPWLNPSEPNVRRSFVSELFANALLFSWKLNRLSHNV